VQGGERVDEEMVEVFAKALREAGKEFHRCGAAIENALDSKDEDALGTTRKLDEEERRVRAGL